MCGFPVFLSCLLSRGLESRLELFVSIKPGLFKNLFDLDYCVSGEDYWGAETFQLLLQRTFV